MNLKNYKELIHHSKIFFENKGHKKVIFLRSCENLGSLSGSLNGWLDVKLSEYGRRQAKQLGLEYFNEFPGSYFEKIFISDLKRAIETADVCFAFEKIRKEQSSLLREIYFGKNEGLFYDGKEKYNKGLTKEKKTELGNPKYFSPKGEGWLDIKYRSVKFLNLLNQYNEGNYVVFTHGGFLSSMLSCLGYQKILPHGTLLFANIETLINHKESDEILEEYNQKLYKHHTNERSISEDDYSKFNTSFDIKIKQHIKSVDYVFTIPDLEEEL